MLFRSSGFLSTALDRSQCILPQCPLCVERPPITTPHHQRPLTDRVASSAIPIFIRLASRYSRRRYGNGGTGNGIRLALFVDKEAHCCIVGLYSNSLMMRLRAVWQLSKCTGHVRRPFEEDCCCSYVQSDFLR